MMKSQIDSNMRVKADMFLKLMLKNCLVKQSRRKIKSVQYLVDGCQSSA